MLRNRVLVFILIAVSFHTYAQPPGTIIDQVAAVVGGKIVLKSDIESQYHQFISQGNYADSTLRCKILDQLMLNKLLLNQALLDSIVVTDDQVSQKIDQNMNYYIQQIGSAEKLEAYYGKSIPELKEEFRPLVKDQLLTQQMQQKVTKNVTASPLDVKEFYESIPPDSLPLINTEVEYAQIVKEIPVSAEQKADARKRLEDLRERLLKGEDFATLAILYSQDVESAKQGGELGFVNRGDLVPEFEAAAFRLKNTSAISDIVETKYGFHIIQLIERRGEKINVRHILIKPGSTANDLTAPQQLMDSVATAIRSGKLTFANAAEKFSDDADSKLNGGIVANPSTGAVRFESSAVDPAILFQLDKLNVGEISNPILTTTHEGRQAYQIVKLIERTEPHKLNINQDYNRLQEITLNQKQQKAVDEWKNRRKQTTYIRVSDEYKDCTEMREWEKKVE